MLVVGQGESIVVDAVPAIFDVLLRDKVGYRFVDGQSAAIFPPHRSLVLLTPKPGEASRWYTAWPTKWLVHDLGDGFRVVALDGSWPQEGFDAVAGPRTFQTGIELQGYAWEPDGEDRGQFWLLWQVLWSDPEDTHFSVHLLDKMTLFWGQRDSVGFPTEYRRKGDRVVSLFDITRENPAVFTPVWARAVLYLYPQVVNIPLIDEAGNQIGDAVEMGPLSKSE